jgi:uncharacterized protein (TIGR00730 family)
MRQFKSVAVFCGSKSGGNQLFTQHSEELGKILASHQITLIYGGGNIGLMGKIADAVLESGGRVTGIMPESLAEREIHHNGITELLIVDTMHTRKRLLYEKCDAAIILPGGYGTMDEVFEMLTWNQLSIHDKKIFIMNTAGFYDQLISHIHKMHDEGFLYGHPYDTIVVLNEPQQLKNYFLDIP